MKKQLITLLIGCLLGMAAQPGARAQVDKKILFAGADLLRGVGKYNGLALGVGLNARLHYPLTPALALTGKVGVEYYKLSMTITCRVTRTWGTAIML
ncbi:hypothetical protein [Spirosoma areae]